MGWLWGNKKCSAPSAPVKEAPGPEGLTPRVENRKTLKHPGLRKALVPLGRAGEEWKGESPVSQSGGVLPGGSEHTCTWFQQAEESQQSCRGAAHRPRVKDSKRGTLREEGAGSHFQPKLIFKMESACSAAINPILLLPEE